jgi:glycosyltransferase involved in cell wall biosynthesis
LPASSNPSRVAELLQRADVLALPNPASAISTRFTSPLKLFEYMSAGARSSRRTCRRFVKFCITRWTRLLVAPGDPQAFAGAIERLVAQPGLSARLARAAFDAA